jgi:hypothetical protein
VLIKIIWHLYSGIFILPDRECKTCLERKTEENFPKNCFLHPLDVVVDGEKAWEKVRNCNAILQTKYVGSREIIK